MSEKVLKRAGMYRFLLYIPEVESDLFQAFVEKCQSQGSSASQVLMEYVRSQMPLISREMGESESNACFKCGLVSDFLTQFRAASGRKLWACTDHFKEYEMKGLVRVVLKKPANIGPERSGVFNPNLGILGSASADYKEHDNRNKDQGSK